VATYGGIAALVGMPRGARVVGYALRAENGGVLPWQRVIGRRRRGVGQVSIKQPLAAAMQRKLLEREGVRFSPKGEVSLERYGWPLKERRSERRSAARRGRRQRS
jgi:methylated-DNA-protein-cysteine methyltransferase-like protein